MSDLEQRLANRDVTVIKDIYKLYKHEAMRIAYWRLGNESLA